METEMFVEHILAMVSLGFFGAILEMCIYKNNKSKWEIETKTYCF